MISCFSIGSFREEKETDRNMSH